MFTKYHPPQEPFKYFQKCVLSFIFLAKPRLKLDDSDKIARFVIIAGYSKTNVNKLGKFG